MFDNAVFILCRDSAALLSVQLSKVREILHSPRGWYDEQLICVWSMDKSEAWTPSVPR